MNVATGIVILVTLGLGIFGYMGNLYEPNGNTALGIMLLAVILSQCYVMVQNTMRK